jgi:hypothetical protein
VSDYLDFDQEELKRKVIKDGNYTAVIQSAEKRATAYDERQNEINWVFRTDGNDDHDINGLALFQGTNIERGKGDDFLKFAAALGFVQDGRVRLPIDEDNRISAVENMRVRIRVITRSRKRKGTGEKYQVNEVADILEVLPD